MKSSKTSFIFFLPILIISFYGISQDKKMPIVKYGGYLIYEKNGHGLIATEKMLGKMEYKQAIKACDDLITGGFEDWHLPTKEEFDLIHPRMNLKKTGQGGLFQSSWYWTSTEVDKGNAWTHNLNNGVQSSYYKEFKCMVMAVRTF